MRFKVKEVKRWNKWFAWYPVEIDGYCHWLETVERKVWDDVLWDSYRYRTPNKDKDK